MVSVDHVYGSIKFDIHICVIFNRIRIKENNFRKRISCDFSLYNFFSLKCIRIKNQSLFLSPVSSYLWSLEAQCAKVENNLCFSRKKNLLPLFSWNLMTFPNPAFYTSIQHWCISKIRFYFCPKLKIRFLSTFFVSG